MLETLVFVFLPIVSRVIGADIFNGIIWETQLWPLSVSLENSWSRIPINYRNPTLM